MGSRTVFKIGIAAALLMALAACARNIEPHGDLPLPERLSQVAPGRTKSDVLALLGTPSTTFNLGTERWYYISNQTEAYAIFPIEEVERQVIVVDFDKAGTVTKVSKLSLADGKDVSMVGRETPTSGQGVSVITQLIGNIGRFSTDSSSQ